ncbi:chromosome partitioning protein [Parelusimicrobium proximum]|uniref:ParA family protein n=1 Tax=Parelusimicrobium proximum TaxID=3228953 RepID=UPI003D178FC1
MGEIIAIANQKGGVGKTTTSINLAYALAMLGKQTLLVDFDPQGNASSGLGITLNEGEPSVYHILTKDSTFEKVVRPSSNELLDVLPACKNLAGAEVELVNMDGREAVLKNVLDPVKKMYDFIIIDCPPSLSLITLNALVAADSVITPIQCEYYAMEGLAHFINTTSKIKQFLNPKLNIDGGLMTMYDSRMNLSNQVLEEVGKFYGDKVYKTPIPRNIRLAEAPSFGQSIFEYEPACKGADSYISLALELLQRRGETAVSLKDLKADEAVPSFN